MEESAQEIATRVKFCWLILASFFDSRTIEATDRLVLNSMIEVYLEFFFFRFIYLIFYLLWFVLLVFVQVTRYISGDVEPFYRCNVIRK